MGSPSMIQLLPKIHLEKRIGLSATPSRKYDMVGNVAIETFFEDKPPYVYSYTMKQALESKWLCHYYYYPHVVYLTEIELEKYISYSKQLLKYFDPQTKRYKDCKEVEFLLLARKRIIHKAENKKAVFEKILENEFNKRGNLKYTLVYVPEGIEADYSQIDEGLDIEEEQSLIDSFTKAISYVDPSVMVKQYTSNTPDRDAVIGDFATGKVHVLTSMKCLDEGVDVPRSELAIFCASTGNPRQFIQRRGRVLRLHEDKTVAVIHDLVVVPLVADNDGTFEMEKNLVSKEIERVVDFSELAVNKVDSYNELRDILEYYDLNLNDFTSNND
jgi:superfamily II DNA or RNA helicase